MNAFDNLGLILLSLVLIHTTNIISSNQFDTSKYYAKTTGLICRPNLDYVDNTSCILKPLNWEKSIAIMECYLKEPITNGTLRFEAFKYTNQFRPFLINITINICRLMKGGIGGAYIKTVYKILLNNSNLIHQCPLEGHLYARDVMLDLNDTAFIIPVGKYKLILTFYEGWPLKLYGVVEYIFSVIERRRTRGSRNLNPMISGK